MEGRQSGGGVPPRDREGDRPPQGGRGLETGAKKLTFAEAYDQIERNVKKRLGQEAYRAWIQRLRDAAFIKIYPFPEDK